MPKYINVDEIRLTAVGTVDEDGDILVSVRDVKKALDQTPAADVAEVRRGEWVYGENEMCHCSECGNEEPEHAISPYCPYCGAQMDDERKEKV